VTLSRAAGWLLLLTGPLGLVSCSDRVPNRPQVAPSDTPPTYIVPTDSTLETNRALWLSSGIHDYRYRFRWSCFCTNEYVRLVDVTVMRGSIVSVVDVSTGTPLGVEAMAGYRTVDGLFDFLREAIDLPAESIRSAFDPHLGYPSATQVDYVANVADEEMAFQIYALSPLHRW
jgi:hypothetical protein